jgi:hypothetical protein
MTKLLLPSYFNRNEHLNNSSTLLYLCLEGTNKSYRIPVKPYCRLKKNGTEKTCWTGEGELLWDFVELGLHHSLYFLVHGSEMAHQIMVQLT